MESAGDFKNYSSIVRIFGHDVIDFSSQYGAETRMSYTAQNLAGKFTIYPNYGDFTQACVFRTYGPWWNMAPSAPKPFRKSPSAETCESEDFIELLFEERLYPVAVQIYETYNPGAIIRIMGSDYKSGTDVDTGRQCKWITLWSRPVVPTVKRARIFSPPIKKIDMPINLIRLELNHSLMDYYTELDCIVLCGIGQKPAADEYSSLRAHVVQLQTVESTGDCVTSNLDHQEDDISEDLTSFHITDADQNVDDKDYVLFEMLPGEIILMILTYLDFSSLGRVAQTCRLLHKYACDPILYTEVNLQPIWHLVSDATLDCLSKCCEQLQRLNLSWSGKEDTLSNLSFERFLQSCSMLTCLQLRSCAFVNQETLTLIASHCPELKELDLNGCSEIDSKSFLCLEQLSKLERLNLYRTRIDTNTTVCVIRSMPELQHLNLGSCKLITNSADVVVKLGLYCPNLHTLDLWRARNMRDNDFQTFIHCCPLLEELDIGWCTELNSRAGSFTCIAENCRNLKKLFLTANRTVCDADLLNLAKYSRHLQQLDILGTREVTSKAAEQVLSSCKEMVLFDVSFCAGISNDDVLLWKQKYPSVSIKKSLQNNSDYFFI